MEHVTCDTNTNSKRILRAPRSIIRERGFTLVESLVYIGILAVMISATIYFLTSIFGSFGTISAQKEVMSQIQHAIDTMTEEIKFSRSVYTPTSNFNNDAGQLSVETFQNPPTGETSTYVDFYIDNGRIYMKKEGQPEIALTSNQIKVTKLKFTYLNPANAPEGTQIFTQAQYNTTNAELAAKTLINLTTSAIIRYK